MVTSFVDLLVGANVNGLGSGGGGGGCLQENRLASIHLLFSDPYL